MSLAVSRADAVPGNDARPWFVGYTKPRQERRAVENLTRQGFECRVPQIRVRKPAGMELVWQAVAMFPRYVFLRPASGVAPLDRVRSTYGMSGLVRFSGVPATVAGPVVEHLVQRGEIHREDLFAPGEPVHFVDGPLAGLEGVFERAEGEERSVVLLEFLQRQQRVTVSTRMLAASN